jgi:leader peptidase (prepilin peptidase)/N-methyltransferase
LDGLLSAETPAALIAVGCGLVLASVAASPDADGVLGGVLAVLMLAIAAADHRHYIIPDGLSGAAFAIGLVHAAAVSPYAPLDGAGMGLLRGILAAGALFVFRFAYFRLRGREGVGLGDVKLAGVAGVWLSLPMIVVAIEIAALAALAVYGLQQMRRARALRATAMLPFGLFFAPAIWLGWLFESIAAFAF